MQYWYTAFKCTGVIKLYSPKMNLASFVRLARGLTTHFGFRFTMESIVMYVITFY